MQGMLLTPRQDQDTCKVCFLVSSIQPSIHSSIHPPIQSTKRLDRSQILSDQRCDLKQAPISIMTSLQAGSAFLPRKSMTWTLSRLCHGSETLHIKTASLFARLLINHQPSTINHQPSTINHQPSTINHQPSTINHQSQFDQHQNQNQDQDLP